MITGDELSIFPDATVFLARLADEGIRTGRLVVPASSVEVGATVAVTGTPDEYLAAVMQHTLRLLATIASVDDVVAAWG
jgi:hypothetical protein